MPMYEYTCEHCGAKLELIRRLSQRDDPATCPGCGAAAQRVISGFSIGGGGGGVRGGVASTSASCAPGG